MSNMHAAWANQNQRAVERDRAERLQNAFPPQEERDPIVVALEQERSEDPAADIEPLIELLAQSTESIDRLAQCVADLDRRVELLERQNEGLAAVVEDLNGTEVVGLTD